MKIILPAQVVHHAESRIRAKYPDVHIVTTNDAGIPDGDVSDATILVRWWYTLEDFMRIMHMAPNIKWVYTPSAGIEYMDLAYMQARNIVLTNAAGVHAIPIAEFIMMFILHHAKRAPLLRDFPRERQNDGNYWVGWDWSRNCQTCQSLWYACDRESASSTSHIVC
jgi:phosphoglycerate dehydrogenase-like enzyme